MNTIQHNLGKDYSDKPLNMSDEDYDCLLAKGYSMEAVKSLASPYDPDKHYSYIKRIYDLTASQPAPVDEQRALQARLLSNIADTIETIARLWEKEESTCTPVSNGDDNLVTVQIDRTLDHFKNKYCDRCRPYLHGAYRSIKVISC